MLSIKSFKRMLRFRKKKSAIPLTEDGKPNLTKIGYNMNMKFAEIHRDNIKPYPINGFCGECKYLSVTEKNQTDLKEPHICTRYNEQIKHDIYHPNLPKLIKCDV